MQWDLRTASKDPISLSGPAFYNPWASKDEGYLVAPGDYTVMMTLWQDGESRQLGGPQSFTVKKLDNTTFPAQNRDALAAFKAEVSNIARAIDGAASTIGDVNNELKYIRKAITRVEVPSAPLLDEVRSIETELREIRTALLGDGVAATLDIYQPTTVADRVGYIVYEQKYSTAPTTGTHRATLAIAQEEFKPLLERLRVVVEDKMVALRENLRQAGAPYTPNNLPVLIRE